jgi:hypothetical protein
MSVQKPISTNIESHPFTMIDNKVINEIDNMEAFTVWVYLLSKSENWDVIRSHVKNRFGIGDAKLESIFAYLNAHNLIEYRRERLPNGRLGKVEIWILNGSRWTKEPNKNGISTTPSKTTGVDNHSHGSGKLLKKDKALNHREEQQLNKEEVVVFSDEDENQEQPADLITTMELVENEDTKAVEDFMREMFRSDSEYNLNDDEVLEHGLG